MDLTAFKDAGCLPNMLDISRINEGDVVEVTLHRHAPKFHSSCRLVYNKTGLRREKPLMMDSQAQQMLSDHFTSLTNQKFVASAITSYRRGS